MPKNYSIPDNYSKPDGYPMLDNPVWHALKTSHNRLAEGTSGILRYPSGILSFMGLDDNLLREMNGTLPGAMNNALLRQKNSGNNPLDDLLPWIQPKEKLFLVGQLPPLPEKWEVLTRLDCLQMICHRPSASHTLASNVQVSQRLTPDDRQDMLELVNSVQPGYYKLDTPSLGSYFGIRAEGRLVAMTGERMKISGFSEVSAVVTHPDYAGKGFARQLLASVCSHILQEGNIPFLHVSVRNSRAIRLYEWMGFGTRREIPFWQIICNA